MWSTLFFCIIYTNALLGTLCEQNLILYGVISLREITPKLSNKIVV